MARLFIVPSLLSDCEWQNVLPATVFNVVTNTCFFIVENIRSARRFLKKVNSEIDIDKLTFFELNKHTDISEITGFLSPIVDNNDIAVISEAGSPGVADPGAEVVRIAHQKGYQVVPLAGPSSILLGLMASGLNGQNFTFHGYLPVRKSERIKAVTALEKTASRLHQTQIFIETPYRNNALLEDLLSVCQPDTLLCIAANITGENEFISTKTVSGWKKNKPDLHKQPAIFLIG
ncbi:MAG: SAM-dependent methyltransferase [Prolixibacteraceae bacterium]|nr:SAM-dependent methyltransferase [Prolixibacteraceae bacterium]